jgi:hypothetical protein
MASFLRDVGDRMTRALDLEHHQTWVRHFDCGRARAMLRENCSTASAVLAAMEESLREGPAPGSIPAYGAPARDVASTCLGADQAQRIGSLAVEYSELALVLPTVTSETQRAGIVRDAARTISAIRATMDAPSH